MFYFRLLYWLCFVFRIRSVTQHRLCCAFSVMGATDRFSDSSLMIVSYASFFISSFSKDFESSMRVISLISSDLSILTNQILIIAHKVVMFTLLTLQQLNFGFLLAFFQTTRVLYFTSGLYTKRPANAKGNVQQRCICEGLMQTKSKFTTMFCLDSTADDA